MIWLLQDQVLDNFIILHFQNCSHFNLVILNLIFDVRNSSSITRQENDNYKYIKSPRLTMIEEVKHENFIVIYTKPIKIEKIFGVLMILVPLRTFSNTEGPDLYNRSQVTNTVGVDN